VSSSSDAIVAGTINISGGIIIATGGSEGTGGITPLVKMSITGGLVTATGYAYGIGSNWAGSTNGIIDVISGNAIIITRGIRPALPIGGSMGPAIIINNNNGTMYDSVTLQQNVTFVPSTILTITTDQSITIPSVL